MHTIPPLLRRNEGAGVFCCPSKTKATSPRLPRPDGGRPDRGGKVVDAGKPPSDARGSGGRRYQHGFGEGTDPRPKPRERPQPGQGPRCGATGASQGGGRHNLKAAELRKQNGCIVYHVECAEQDSARQKLRPRVLSRANKNHFMLL